MYYLIANLDKEEYVRPIIMGAPRGAKHYSVARTLLVAGQELTWLLPIICLLDPKPIEANGNVTYQQSEWSKTIRGRWAGHRIAIIRDYDYNPSILSGLSAIMTALAGKPTKIYTEVRQLFTDITPMVQDALKLGTRYHSTSTKAKEAAYEQLCKPKSYGWVKVADVKRWIEAAKATKPASFCPRFLQWLKYQEGVSKQVSDLIKKTLKSLNFVDLREDENLVEIVD